MQKTGHSMLSWMYRTSHISLWAVLNGIKGLGACPTHTKSAHASWHSVPECMKNGDLLLRQTCPRLLQLLVFPLPQLSAFSFRLAFLPKQDSESTVRQGATLPLHTGTVVLPAT